MSSPSLLVISDPAAPFLTALTDVPQDMRVVVTDNAAELRITAPEADAILYAHVNADLLMLALRLGTRVRWVHSLWTGVHGILQPELLAHPATLTNGRGAFRRPLADWVAAVMLFFAFDLRRIIRQQERRVWEPFTSTTLAGQVLGIVGYGAIGRAAADRAQQFGMKIAALRRRSELFPAERFVDQQYRRDQLAELMAASDYILAATPLTAETRGMIGEREIAAMKPAAVIINIGRGAVIDEAALIRALKTGRIRGAALDVFDVEPLPLDHPFWQMPNVLLSPHTADRVEAFLDSALECFFEELSRFRTAADFLNVVDKAAGY